jgi:hypothetical protein
MRRDDGSQGLVVIFRSAFGFDILVVNRRFEASPALVQARRRTVALGSLDAMGLGLGPSLSLRSGVLLAIFRGPAGRPLAASSAGPTEKAPDAAGALTVSARLRRPCGTSRSGRRTDRRPSPWSRR